MVLAFPHKLRVVASLSTLMDHPGYALYKRKSFGSLFDIINNRATLSFRYTLAAEHSSGLKDSISRPWWVAPEDNDLMSGKLSLRFDKFSAFRNLSRIWLLSIQSCLSLSRKSREHSSARHMICFFTFFFFSRKRIESESDPRRHWIISPYLIRSFLWISNLCWTLLWRYYFSKDSLNKRFSKRSYRRIDNKLSIFNTIRSE